MSDREGRMIEFLRLTKGGGWWHSTVPSVWRAQFSEALGDGLVRIGFGGKVVITDAGARQIAKSAFMVADAMLAERERRERKDKAE